MEEKKLFGIIGGSSLLKSDAFSKLEKINIETGKKKKERAKKKKFFFFICLKKKKC